MSEIIEVYVEGPQGPQGVSGVGIPAGGTEGQILKKLGVENYSLAWFDNNKLNGFVDFNDTSTASAPVSIAANTWTDIPNDGLGSFSNLAYQPDNATITLDSLGNFIFSDLSLGDQVIIRNDYTVYPNINNALLKFRYVLGEGASQYTLEKRVGRLDDGAGNLYRESLVADYIYAGDVNTKDYPIKLQLHLSSGGTFTNAGSAIGIFKHVY
jgi:hypothetical protein